MTRQIKGKEFSPLKLASRWTEKNIEIWKTMYERYSIQATEFFPFL